MVGGVFSAAGEFLALESLQLYWRTLLDTCACEWVVHRNKLAMLASISSMQQHPQDFQSQGHSCQGQRSQE